MAEIRSILATLVAGRATPSRAADLRLSRKLAALSTAWSVGYAALSAYWALGGTFLRTQCVMDINPNTATGCENDLVAQHGWLPVGVYAAVAGVALAVYKWAPAVAKNSTELADTPAAGRSPVAFLKRVVATKRLPLLIPAWGVWALLLDTNMLPYSLQWLRVLHLPPGPVDWNDFLTRTLVIGGAGLFGLTAWRTHVATQPLCAECGARRTRRHHDRAPRWAWMAALGVVAASLPYTLLKFAWSIDIPIAGFSYDPSQPHYYLDPTVVAGLLAILLGFGLVHERGRVVPRGLMLVLGWTATAAPLAIGLLSVVGWIAMAFGLWYPPGWENENPYMFAVVYTCFLSLGLLLSALLRSYQRRTKPVCPSCDNEIMP